MIRLILKDSPIEPALATLVAFDLFTTAGVAPDTELIVYYGDLANIPSGANVAIPVVPGPTASDIAGYFEIGGVSVSIIYPEPDGPGEVFIRGRDNIPVLRRYGDMIVFGFDVLRAVAELTSEDPDFRKRGNFGRPDLSAEPAFRRDLLSLPTVNLYARLIRRGIEDTTPAVLRDLWPSDAPYAVLLSHDVDRISSGGRLRRLREALGALKRGERLHNLDLFSKAHRYDSIAAMIGMEQRYGATSTFFFSAIKRGEIDPDYVAEDVARLIEEVNAAGSEVALHPSFYCPDTEGLKDEITALEEVSGAMIEGMRGHFLQPEPPLCFERVEAAGLLYDATPGFPAVPAFRYGVAGPFTPWNGDEGRPYDIISIPMMCMDGTLYRYLRMNRRRARERIFELIDMVKASGGAFSLLWHSDTFPGGSKPKWGWVYEETLRKAKEDGAAFMTHKECAEWYGGRKVEVEVAEG